MSPFLHSSTLGLALRPRDSRFIFEFKSGLIAIGVLTRFTSSARESCGPKDGLNTVYFPTSVGVSLLGPTAVPESLTGQVAKDSRQLYSTDTATRRTPGRSLQHAADSVTRLADKVILTITQLCHVTARTRNVRLKGSRGKNANAWVVYAKSFVPVAAMKALFWQHGAIFGDTAGGT